MAESSIKQEQSKNAGNENFPVGRVVRKELRPLVAAYYAAARAADDIADSPFLSPQEKNDRLELARQSFLKPDNEADFSEAAVLGRLFRQERLDASLYLDLLEAFRRDALNAPLQIWAQLTDYCTYSAVPVGRFMLAIHDESPSTYLPAVALCTVLQIVNHLQDMKSDAVNLRRSYLPDDLLERYGVYRRDVCLDKETPGLTALKLDICGRCRGLLKDALVLPALIKDRRLRAETGIIFSLTNSMLKKIEESDVLRRHVKLSRRDWLRAFGHGLRTMWLPRRKFRTK